MQPTQNYTIRCTPKDLASIDTLVSSGFASTRADYIRRAVREQISRDAESLKV